MTLFLDTGSRDAKDIFCKVTGNNSPAHVWVEESGSLFDLAKAIRSFHVSPCQNTIFIHKTKDESTGITAATHKVSFSDLYVLYSLTTLKAVNEETWQHDTQEPEDFLKYLEENITEEEKQQAQQKKKHFNQASNS